MIGFLTAPVQILVGIVVIAARMAQRAARRVRRLGDRPPVALLTMRGMEAGPMSDDDLYACPRSLDQLDERMGDRLRAVAAQADVLRSRREEMAQKGGREELAKKYGEDVTMLNRRAASMRRVRGLVWKTRAILLLRAHLAQTARRRPVLGALPPLDPAPAGAARLKEASSRYHTAAIAVRNYLELVEARALALPAQVPPEPMDAEIDAPIRGAVTAAVTEQEDAYAALAEEMDRLADNLTWLADHCASLAVVESANEPSVRAPGGVDGGPAELVREIEDAMSAVAGLARAVDPALADAAVAHLAEDISQLEEAGLEAQAEAEAAIEVSRLLATG